MDIYPSGTLIANRYEVVQGPVEKRSLAGGMGIVYLCFDHEEQRPVALKTFKPEYLPDRAARDRFLREGTTWVDLGNHPHVVRCYQVLRIDPEVYLVLELVAKEEGRPDASLRSWLVPGRPLPVEQALLFGLQIARGMAHATAVIPGFVHRDLKPENVLVGVDRLSNAGINRVRVTDFGLAAVMEAVGIRTSETSEASTGLGRTQLTRGVVGTPLYMAPEQWREERMGVQTDVYALGCILYEMLAGQRAVEEGSIATLERVHCAGEIRSLPDGLPATVGAVVTRCLAREPGARYGSWEGMEEELVGAYEEVTGRVAPGPEPVQALDRAERVAAVGREEGEPQLEGAGLTHLGLAYADLGDARRAIRFHEQALKIHREIDNRQGEGETLGNLGNAYHALSEFRRAIECHEQDLAIAREIGNRYGEGRALGNLGSIYINLAKFSRAIEFLEQSLAIDREIGNRRGEVTALGNLGTTYSILGQTRRAIELLERSLTIARETGDREQESSVLGSLAIVYKNLGKLDKATERYAEALTISQELGNQEGELSCLTGLGLISARLGEVQQAIHYHNQALDIARRIGSQQAEATALGNLANAYHELGGKQQAMDYNQQKLTIVRQIGDRRGEGQVLGNIAILYSEWGDTTRAFELYTQALKIKQEIGDVVGVSNTSLNLAGLLVRQGYLREALVYAEDAVRGYTEVGWSDRAQYAQQIVAQIRAHLGQSGSSRILH